MPPPVSEICGNCKYWKRLNDTKGECHVNAPKPETEFNRDKIVPPYLEITYPVVIGNMIGCKDFMKI